MVMHAFFSNPNPIARVEPVYEVLSCHRLVRQEDHKDCVARLGCHGSAKARKARAVV